MTTKPHEVELLERQIARWPKAFTDDETYLGKFTVVNGVERVNVNDFFDMEIVVPSRAWGIPREETMFAFFNDIKSRAEAFVLNVMKDMRATRVVGDPQDIYGKWTLIEWSGPDDCIRLKIRCEFNLTIA